MSRALRNTMIFPVLFLLLAACSQLRQMTPVDRQYLFLPQDVKPYPFEAYRQKKAWGDADYMLFTKRDQTGFQGMYGTILTRSGSRDIKYLCLVNVLPSFEKAQSLYDHLVPEPRPRKFGKEVTVSPIDFNADSAYLYESDTGYFHLVLKAGLTVYSVVFDGTLVDQASLTKNLQSKLDFIRHNEALFR